LFSTQSSSRQKGSFHIMIALATRKPGFKRNLLLNLAFAFAITLPTGFELVEGNRAAAQVATAATQDIVTTLQGTLHVGQDVIVIDHVEKPSAN
jgi:hypothetical protein